MTAEAAEADKDEGAQDETMSLGVSHTPAASETTEHVTTLPSINIDGEKPASSIRTVLGTTRQYSYYWNSMSNEGPYVLTFPKLCL